MLYTKKALQMGAIAVGLAAFAGQSSLAESAKKEDSKPSASSETMQVMPELTMASHFTGVPYNRSGVSVSIINPEEFQKAGIETLTGALSQTPGVFTLDGGGTWQRGSVSNTVIRGMNKETYTLTMVDGMRISDVNMSGNKLLGITNLFTVDNVEVVKGAQGAVFGSGAIGGVVAMDTPEGEGDPVTRIFAEAGSFHSFNSYATSSGKIKKLSYFVGVGFESTENDPTIYPAIYDNRKGMNDFRQWQEAVRLGYDVNDKVKVGFTYRRLDSYFEYPTPYVDYDQWPAVTDPHPVQHGRQEPQQPGDGARGCGNYQAVVHQLHDRALQHGLFHAYAGLRFPAQRDVQPPLPDGMAQCTYVEQGMEDGRRHGLGPLRLHERKQLRGQG